MKIRAQMLLVRINNGVFGLFALDETASRTLRIQIRYVKRREKDQRMVAAEDR